MPHQPDSDTERLRHWVDTWRLASPELADIRRREIQSLVTLADTKKAIRQLFGTGNSLNKLPHRTTPGLVE